MVCRSARVETAILGLDVVEADHRASAPVVLDDDASGEAGAGVVLDEGLMERLLHIPARGGEVGEIQHGDILEVAGEMARVIAGVQLDELRNRPQSPLAQRGTPLWHRHRASLTTCGPPLGGTLPPLSG